MKVAGVVFPVKDVATGPARDGGVWVMAERCETCIFHPGNRMHLNAGTVATMKRSADECGTCIICHEGMNGPNAAVCRGYYDNHQSKLLRMAEGMGLIKMQGNTERPVAKLPPKERTTGTGKLP